MSSLYSSLSLRLEKLKNILLWRVIALQKIKSNSYQLSYLHNFINRQVVETFKKGVGVLVKKKKKKGEKEIQTTNQQKTNHTEAFKLIFVRSYDNYQIKIGRAHVWTSVTP